MTKTGIHILIFGLAFIINICYGQEEVGNTDYQYALIEAVKQKNLGNLTEAVKLYKLVIREKPDCDVAHYELGSIYMILNQVKAAKESLEIAYELDQDNQWYTLAFLNALGANEEFDRIVEILQQKIKDDPEEAEWEFQLAIVYVSKGKPGKAIRTLERIEKERGFSEKVTLQKASIYEREKEYEKARLEIEKVMNLFPETIQFRIVAAELCLKSGEEAAAAEYYLEILEMDSLNIFALTNLTDYYRKKEDYENSLKYLSRSFSNNMIDVTRKKAILSYYLSEDEFVKKHSEALDRLIQVFVNTHPEDGEGKLMAADFYIETRSYGKAYGQLAGYLERNEGNYPMYMQAILLANAASMNQELINITGKAMELYPDSSDIRFFRCIGFYETGKYDSLIITLNDIEFTDFTVREYASQSKMLLAESYYRIEDYPASDSLFEALIREEPDNDMVLNNYSYYLAERGVKLLKAKQWSGQTIARNPENATFLDTYAWILFKLKEYEEAEKYILHALEKGGENDPEVNEHAGDIQKALKSYDIAKSYYQKALIVGGNKVTLEKKIESLMKGVNE